MRIGRRVLSTPTHTQSVSATSLSGGNEVDVSPPAPVKFLALVIRRAFLFGSRVIRDLLGASCSDALTTALSWTCGAGSLWLDVVRFDSRTCFLGIAVSL